MLARVYLAQRMYDATRLALLAAAAQSGDGRPLVTAARARLAYYGAAPRRPEGRLGGRRQCSGT